jgi:hypothetical protein
MSKQKTNDFAKRFLKKADIKAKRDRKYENSAGHNDGQVSYKDKREYLDQTDIDFSPITRGSRTRYEVRYSQTYDGPNDNPLNFGLAASKIEAIAEASGYKHGLSVHPHFVSIKFTTSESFINRDAQALNCIDRIVRDEMNYQ